MTPSSKSILARCGVFLVVNLPAFAADNPGEAGCWVSLFNGKNPDGWTVKITNHSPARITPALSASKTAS